MHREYEERVNGFRSARKDQPPQYSAKDCFHVMFILFLFYYEVVKKLIDNVVLGFHCWLAVAEQLAFPRNPKSTPSPHPPVTQVWAQVAYGGRGSGGSRPPSKQSVKIIRNLAYIVLLAKGCDVHCLHAITGLLKQDLRLQSMSTAFYLSPTLDSPTLLVLKSALTAVPL